MSGKTQESGLCGWQDGFSMGRLVELACVLEATASKPGNVHRGADFEDVGFADFLASAIAMGQAIDESGENGYGETVLRVAQRTSAVANSNTNLGMNLLITALAKAVEASARGDYSAAGKNKLTTQAMSSFLAELTLDDTAKVYEAIRLMKPSGLGKAQSHDVNDFEGAQVSLVETMKLSADRDAVANQFVSDFQQVIDVVPQKIVEGRKTFGDLSKGIVFAHVWLMSVQPDSLIARKCGDKTARKSQSLSQKAIDSIGSDVSLKSYWRAVGELDFWLRSDGHRRNPGTTADLIAAGLFVAAYNGLIDPPFN